MTAPTAADSYFIRDFSSEQLGEMETKGSSQPHLAPVSSTKVIVVRQMLLPNAERATVDRAKITEYLLSESHIDGRSKAVFFAQFGFKREDWEILAKALLRLAVSNPVSKSVESAYGTRYIVDGTLMTPSGRAPSIRTVWIIDDGVANPRLITAYPSGAKDGHAQRT